MVLKSNLPASAAAAWATVAAATTVIAAATSPVTAAVKATAAATSPVTSVPVAVASAFAALFAGGRLNVAFRFYEEGLEAEAQFARFFVDIDDGDIDFVAWAEQVSGRPFYLHFNKTRNRVLPSDFSTQNGVEQDYRQIVRLGKDVQPIAQDCQCTAELFANRQVWGRYLLKS